RQRRLLPAYVASAFPAEHFLACAVSSAPYRHLPAAGYSLTSVDATGADRRIPTPYVRGILSQRSALLCAVNGPALRPEGLPVPGSQSGRPSEPAARRLRHRRSGPCRRVPLQCAATGCTLQHGPIVLVRLS